MDHENDCERAVEVRDNSEQTSVFPGEVKLHHEVQKDAQTDHPEANPDESARRLRVDQKVEGYEDRIHEQRIEYAPLSILRCALACLARERRFEI